MPAAVDPALTLDASAAQSHDHGSERALRVQRGRLVPGQARSDSASDRYIRVELLCLFPDQVAKHGRQLQGGQLELRVDEAAGRESPGGGPGDSTFGEGEVGEQTSILHPRGEVTLAEGESERARLPHACLGECLESASHRRGLHVKGQRAVQCQLRRNVGELRKRERPGVEVGPPIAAQGPLSLCPQGSAEHARGEPLEPHGVALQAPGPLEAVYRNP